MLRRWNWHILIATLFVFWISFLITRLIEEIPYLEPLSDSVEDFDFSDFAYNDFNRRGTKTDSSIVLVNFGEIDRIGIADIINKLAVHKPKVVGLNVFFYDRRSPEDSILRNAIMNLNNVVSVAAAFEDTLQSSHSYFVEGTTYGVSNITVDTDGTIREFLVEKNYGGEKYESFAASLARSIDKRAVEVLNTRDNEYEIIAYGGGGERYKTIHPWDTNFSTIEEKIVIVGFCGDGFGNSIEDMFFTPIKWVESGKLFPDMYSSAIQANIVSQILNQEYINRNEWLDTYGNFILAILGTFFFVYIFEKYPSKHSLISHFATVILILLAISTCVFFYKNYDFKFDTRLSVLFLIFAPDVLEYYYKFLKSNLDTNPLLWRIFRLTFISMVFLYALSEMIHLFFNISLINETTSFLTLSVYFVILNISCLLYPYVNRQ